MYYCFTGVPTKQNCEITKQNLLESFDAHILLFGGNLARNLGINDSEYELKENWRRILDSDAKNQGEGGEKKGKSRVCMQSKSMFLLWPT